MAVRDAVILADARIDELTDPPMLKAWLFAIARAECQRHCPGSSGESDEPVAYPRQRDAALRIMAWKAAISLPAGEREALDLVTRHGMTPPEVALVLGMPAPEAPALIAAARQHLEQALAAEILINREGQECAGRAGALQGWTGTVTPAVRERLLRHAGSCPACAPRLPRNVSAAKIFGLLPEPALAEGGWAGVLEPPQRSGPGGRTGPAGHSGSARCGGSRRGRGGWDGWRGRRRDGWAGWPGRRAAGTSSPAVLPRRRSRPGPGRPARGRAGPCAPPDCRRRRLPAAARQAPLRRDRRRGRGGGRRGGAGRREPRRAHHAQRVAQSARGG